MGNRIKIKNGLKNYSLSEISKYKKIIIFRNKNNLVEKSLYHFNNEPLIWFFHNIKTSDNSELKSLINTFTEMDGFWSNLTNYARYFISVMLGTTYIMLKPIIGTFRNPKSAVATLLIIFCAVYILFIT